MLIYREIETKISTKTKPLENRNTSTKITAKSANKNEFVQNILKFTISVLFFLFAIILPTFLCFRKRTNFVKTISSEITKKSTDSSSVSTDTSD